jgi:site-specific recombinase XerD
MSKPQSELIENFQFACRLKRLTDLTMRGYNDRLFYLENFGKTLNKSLDTLTQKDIQNYILKMLDTVSSYTINGRIRVYKIFYKHLKNEGLVDYDPMLNIKLVRTEKRIKPVLSTDEMGLILFGCDRKTYCGMRDYCLILLTYDALLRLNEVLSIKLEDINLSTKIVKVHGKGSKDRFCPFSDKTAKSLHTFTLRYRKEIAGTYLFPMHNGAQLTHRRAHAIFKKAGKRVGLYCYPHLCRHSGATEFARAGASIAILSKILGHSTLQVTQKYVHLNVTDMSSAYEKHAPGNKL